MSDTAAATSTPPVSNEPPPDAGLSTGRPGATARDDRRSGDDLIGAAARGEALIGGEPEDLLDYFLANGQLPDDDKPHPVQWDIGTGKSKRSNTWLAKRIGWDDWTESEARSRDEKTGIVDGYTLASYVVAHALVRPQLGPSVLRMQSKDPETAPADAAELLRRMFRKQPGTLAAISAEVRQISRLGNDQESARTLDQEVAAGEA